MKVIRNLAYLAFICFFMVCTTSEVHKFDLGVAPGDFGAFYTKINSGERFEKYSRTGDYADIIVDLGDGNGKFVFWRGSSYLPFFQTSEGKWYVDEIVPRKGDGSNKMPDKTNTFSVVKIIESTSEKVVIHWRYLPEFSGINPKIGVLPTKFVDEYFYITPDKKVTRTVKQGTEKIDDWRDPLNITTQTFTLAENGITDKNITQPGKSAPKPAVKGAPVVKEVVVKPALWWKFDEAKGGIAVESINIENCTIEGNKSLWRRGVSGTALQFDGYNSVIKLPADKAPKVSTEITLEAWVAIGAYPWSWVPIIQQCDDVPEEIQAYRGQRAVLTGEEDEGEEDESKGEFRVELKKENDTGYFLGIDGHGYPGFKIKVGDTWEELVSNTHLERRRWYHIAATYDKDSGKMIVYVNCKPAGEKSVAKANIVTSTKDLAIGKGKKRRPVDPVRKNTFPDFYAFDGLIDEVRVYDIALSPERIAQSYKNIKLTYKERNDPEMDKRVLPSGENTRKFGACCAHLKFYDIWDNLWRFSEHPDVVVEFDELPTKFVFWRGVGYIPMMVNEKGQWYTNEFNETWNKSGGRGCQEPMSDKESYTNHAKIIENTPARVVVQWRYPLIDVNHVMANYDSRTGWCDWSDWYYYIYPDGVAVKTMHLWTHGERNHEWQESIAIFGPEQHPEDIIHKKAALTMVNLKGDYKVYNWIGKPPEDVEEPEGKCIQYINYTGEYDPITIGDFQWSNVYGGELTSYSVFPTWNHWPVAQMPSDGRYASFPDRSAHSSLTHVGLPIYKEEKRGNTPYYEKIMMECMLNTKPLDLIPLAKSWMQAPALTEVSGCSGEYDKGQRAYVLTAESFPITFNLDCSKNSPMVNACFVIKGWGNKSVANLKIDGKQIESGSNFRQGLIRDTNGTQTMVIWIKYQSTSPESIEITRE